MKRFLFNFMVALPLVLLMAISVYSREDRVIARVNNDVITLSDLEERMRPIVAKYEKSYDKEELLKNLSKAEDYWLNQLIENKLILQEADRKNITATKEEIDERYEKIKSDFDSDIQFKIFLESQGMNIGQLKKNIEENIKIAKTTGHIRAKARQKISPKDIAEYYDKHNTQFRDEPLVKASHILIRSSGENDPEAYQKAKDILARLKKGEDFATLAKEYSDDPHAQQGGDLGFFSKGQHIPEIDKVVFNMQVGQTSGIIKSKLGYHILYLKQKKIERVKPLAETQEEIENILLKEKAHDIWDEWIKGLKKKSFVEIYEK